MHFGGVHFGCRALASLGHLPVSALCSPLCIPLYRRVVRFLRGFVSHDITTPKPAQAAAVMPRGSARLLGRGRPQGHRGTRAL